ncbi:MAG: hypothetical protein HRT89_04645 [Lentisphaeria bacterium]|nr:hypothetical protein [Lentisphaeria bacterium]NQZ67336.1 hypothetical protein [Lentisphaeria bacterium]
MKNKIAGSILFVSSILFVFFSYKIYQLSDLFVYGENHSERPVLEFTGAYLALWFIYAAGIFAVYRLKHKGFLFVIFAVAIIARICMLNSNVILEHDFYRYMWEGKEITQGINPFAKAPVEVGVSLVEPDETRHAEVSLIQDRIYYSELTSVYPHLAQATFALNAMLWDWDLYGFRKTFILFDIGIIILFLLILRIRKENRLYLLIYLWNPLLLKEVYNSMHIDIAASFFIILFIFLIHKKQWVFSSFALFAAALVKIMPLLLFPLLYVYFLRTGKIKQFVISSICCLIVGLLCIKSMYIGIDRTNKSEVEAGDIQKPVDTPFGGLKAFSDGWAINGSLHYALAEFYSYGNITLLAPETLETMDAGKIYIRQEQLAKNTLFILLLLIIIGLSLFIKTQKHLLLACGWVVMLIFICSPVGNPWYLLWLLPFLIIYRQWPWLILMICTSLYYHIFWIEYHISTNQEYHFKYLQIIEYLPFFIYTLIWWYYKYKKKMVLDE